MNTHVFTTSTLLKAAFACAVALLLAACGGSSEPLNPGKVTAFVSVAPQAALVKAIGGDLVVVEVLAGAGQDPHDFSPSPKRLMELGRAELWFTTRMPFERSMEKKVRSNAKRLRIASSADGLLKFPPSHPPVETSDDHGEEAHDDHDHDHHHDHDHSAGDPHVWLSPPLLKIQAANIAEALIAADPDHADTYRTNLTAFETHVDQLHGELKASLAPFEGATFLAYHGAFAWFADAYDLHQETIEFNGRSPETKRLREIIEDAKANDIRVVFTQPQFDRKSAEAVAEGLGGSVVEIDPLAEDLFDNLRSVAASLASALAASSPAPSPPE